MYLIECQWRWEWGIWVEKRSNPLLVSPRHTHCIWHTEHSMGDRGYFVLGVLLEELSTMSLLRRAESLWALTTILTMFVVMTFLDLTWLTPCGTRSYFLNWPPSALHIYCFAGDYGQVCKDCLAEIGLPSAVTDCWLKSEEGNEPFLIDNRRVYRSGL